MDNLARYARHLRWRERAKIVPGPDHYGAQEAEDKRSVRVSTIRRWLKYRFPKPEACTWCGGIGPLHIHHYGKPFHQLVKEGVAEDLSQHQVTYVCVPCHQDAHRDDEWAHGALFALSP